MHVLGGLRFNDKRPCRLYYRMGQGNIIGETPCAMPCAMHDLWGVGGGGGSDGRTRQFPALHGVPSWDQDKETHS